MKTEDKEIELWRNVIKLGNCLGDVEDIARRKKLAYMSFKEMKEVPSNGVTSDGFDYVCINSEKMECAPILDYTTSNIMTFVH